MTTISENLIAINQIKQDIALAIESTGVDMNGTLFSDFPFKVGQIQGGGGGNFLSRYFLDGEWSPSEYYKLLTYYPVNSLYSQLPYDEVTLESEYIKMVVSTPFGTDYSVMSFKIDTTPGLYGDGSPAPSFRVDWGDGNIQEYNSGDTATHRFNADITLTLEEVCITVLPINGANFTLVDLGVPHSEYPRPGVCYTPLIQLIVTGPMITTLTLSKVGVCEHPNLVEAYIGVNNAENLSGLFANCTALAYVPSLITWACTDFTSMFENCTALTTIPQFDEANGVHYGAMFRNTTSLVSIPPMNCWNALNVSEMFNGSGVVSCPPFNNLGGSLAPEVQVQVARMFKDCKRLRALPEVRLGNVHMTDEMFSGCNVAVTLGDYQMLLVIQASGMFKDCKNLRSVSLYDTAALTVANEMFSGCTKLEYVDVDMTGVTYFDRTFQNCTKLKQLWLTGFSADIQSTTLTFEGCYSLTSLGIFSNEVPINKFKLVGWFNMDTLNLYFNNLPVWNDPMPQTIDLSQVYGVDLTGADFTVVNGKGYIVTYN